MIRLYIVLISFLSCDKKEEKVYSIQGQLSPPTVKYLILKQETDIERKISVIIDTLYVSKEGKFNTNKKLEPYLYTLQLDVENSIPLAIAKGQYVNISIQNTKTKITGSKDTDALLAYESFRKKSLDHLVQSVRRQVEKLKESENPNEDQIKQLEQLEVENYKKHLVELNSYIKKYMGSSIGLYATSIRWQGTKNIPFYDSLATVFKATYPRLNISKKIREKVTRLKQTSIGGTAPNIEMLNSDGKTKSLYSKHKKYTLIDFWASWCGPCRSESKALNKIYMMYHDKGFEIYGVSLDDNRDKWLKAIAKDHRIWTNVSSLKVFKTEAAFDYAITSLPMNYLIDSNHKIIGKNLHEKELLIFLDSLIVK